MKKLRVRWKEPSVDVFLERHAGDIDDCRAFLKTAHPLRAGTEVRFEFLLPSGDTFLEGSGTIDDVPEDEHRAGMILRFDELSEGSAPFIARLHKDKPTTEVNTEHLLAEDRDLLEGNSIEDTFPDALPAGFRPGKRK